jgi:cellulose synthase operon protein C
MGDQAVQRLLILLALGLIADLASASADATRVPTALRPRQGLTAGGYDHFQGQLAPDGRHIYFAGNANRTVEIFVQNLERGFPKLLFDDSADVHQPRISPDGSRLLYISYQQDAGGDACIYDIEKRKRRCLTEPGTAVLHVFWFPDGESAGVLTRERIDADHRLLRIQTNGRKRGSAETLLERNMSAPAVSPDGRWLAYVPLNRVGRSGGRLERALPGLILHRLDGETAPVEFVPDMPGTSAYPAFGLDGKHLYFVQFLNDTNFDGVIDGNDNGVLFRAPFRTGTSQPVRAETYDQLTSGRNNCQYPAPAEDRLVATCVRSEYLQVYAIPPGGQVDPAWSAERIRAEIQASRDPWEQLLLLRRLVVLEGTSPERRIEIYRRMIMRHVALKEYESAEHYLGILERTARDHPTLAGWVAALQEIIGHRRQEQRLGHGKLTREFIADQRDRLARLEDLYQSPDPTTRRLAHLAESEIYLVLGEKAASKAMFEDVDITDETDPAVLQVWARKGEALLRDLGDREGWMAVHRRLSAHPALEERDRLAHAATFIRIIGRGRNPREEMPRLEEARRRTPDGTELALMLDLEKVLVRVPEMGQQAAVAKLERLWERAPTFEQHRAVAMATIARAARHDWGHLLETFGRRWLEDVPANHPERKYAEALYAEVMLERAYVDLKNGRVRRAKQLFRRITDATPSLEAHVGYIEAALTLGEDPQALLEAYRARFPSTDPVEPFSEAYIVARGLPDEPDPERHASEIARVRALLRPVALELPRSPEVHHLYAYLAHRHYHRTGDKEAAMAAVTRYHLALDLAPHDPRRRANLLTELGLIQAALGNHRIAVRHFTERERLPFMDAESEVAFRLSKARSLFHAASYADAKAEVAHATEVINGTQELAKYLPVVLDRAALYHYAAGVHDRSVELYERLVAGTQGESLAVRMKARMGLGASALAAGDTDRARRTLEEVRTMLDADEPFRTHQKHRKSASHFDRDDYRPLVAGLVAEARRASGDLKGTAAALEERLALYRARHKKYGRDGYLLEMARISYQLAEVSYRLEDLKSARRHLEHALEHADTWRSNTNTEIEEVTLATVRAAAELHLYGDVPLSAFDFDVLERVREVYGVITLRPNPKWADERFLFPAYLTLLETPAR